MQLIDNLDDSANQTTHIVLPDNSVIDLSLQYMPAIQRWKYDLIYNDFQLYGKVLCSHPNLLRQFRNVSGSTPISEWQLFQKSE